MRHLALYLLPAALMTGCAELLPSNSPAYNEGYQDGCASGTAAANPLAAQPTQDTQRYNAVPDYAEGWRQGHHDCDGRNISISPGGPLEPVDIGRNNDY